MKYNQRASIFASVRASAQLQKSFVSSGSQDKLCMVSSRCITSQRSPTKVLHHRQRKFTTSYNADMFWSKEFRPPNSPDLNPFGFYVCIVAERITNKSRHPSFASLKAAIEATLPDMDRDSLKRTRKRFRPRMEAVIHAEGGYMK